MNVSYIISEFGGARPLARLLGYPPTTVQNWESRNSIPSKHQGKILQQAINLGKNITAEHFFDLEDIKHKNKKIIKKSRTN